MSKITVGGVELEYFHHGKSIYEPIILIHGASSSALIWGSTQKYLELFGFESYAISLRGAGRSKHSAILKDYHPSNYALDVLVFLDELQIEQSVIIGHSLGTIVSKLYCSKRSRTSGKIGPNIGTYSSENCYLE